MNNYGEPQSGFGDFSTFFYARLNCCYHELFCKNIATQTMVRIEASNLVALVADAQQFPAAAFVAHRLAATNPRKDTSVAIFSDSFVDLAKAQEWGKIGAELIHTPFANRLPAAEERISGIAFLRLFLPELVGPPVRQILYMDVDVYPAGAALFDVFDLDMTPYAVGAVRDEVISDAELELTDVAPDDYFNSGVLLMDRERCLAENIRQRVIDVSRKTHFNDQAALNRALAGHWYRLPLGVNVLKPFIDSFRRAGGQALISHFIGPIKPWHAAFNPPHPVKGGMKRFLAKSPWPDFVVDQTTPR